MRPRLAVLFLVGTAFAVWGAAIAPVAFAGGGCHRLFDGGRPAEGSGTTVAFQQNCMTPMVLRVGVGETVTFVNEDPVVHNVTGPGLLETLEPGDSVAQRFDDEGVFAYSCTLHAGMTGAVVVGAATSAVPAVGRETTEIHAEPAVASESRGVPASSLIGGGLAIAVLAAVAGFLTGRGRRPRSATSG